MKHFPKSSYRRQSLIANAHITDADDNDDIRAHPLIEETKPDESPEEREEVAAAIAAIPPMPDSFLKNFDGMAEVSDTSRASRAA